MSTSMFPVHFGLPDRRIFQFPPGPHPLPNSPTSRLQLSWDRPININPRLFYYTLDVKFPLIIATSYILVVTVFNYINGKRQNRPWPLSRSPLFHQFVLVHNMGLVLFSAWLASSTYWTIESSFRHRGNTLVSAIDVLCKFDRRNSTLFVGLNASEDLSSDLDLYGQNSGIFQPEALEPESLWDRGIDYYVWMFYISKFYEVVDTILLLVKGRNGSFLQTYHHAGVMLCTWAGMRYASPPIVVGLFLNSAIHTVMYLYYTLTTLRIAIPSCLKRLLTGMQISQFFIGSILAWSYIFILYDTPSWSPLMGAPQPIPCLDNSGQVFAVLLTTFYLIPLTYLFARFFVRSYLSGLEQKPR